MFGCLAGSVARQACRRLNIASEGAGSAPLRTDVAASGSRAQSQTGMIPRPETPAQTVVKHAGLLFANAARLWDGSAGRAAQIQPAAATSAVETSAARAEADVETPSLPEEVRRRLRHLANSVVVCTAHTNTGRADAAEPGPTIVPVGLAMSSFVSLSLYPSPVITFNVAVPSRTEAAIARSRHFMIHVLAGDARGAQVADVFRAGNAHPDIVARQLRRAGCRIVGLARPPHQETRPVSAAAAATNAAAEDEPFLRGPGILYVLRCRLLDEPWGGLVPVRDHVVVLGEVLEIINGGAEDSDGTGAPRFGLVYGDRHYRQLGRAVLHTNPKR
ncbi:Flavin reductase-like, FMN-binding protein [Niveomyces insectorum RCEF 264]|uniref:Flavin reductase-like, FMN-binding protein n=1 Tax=Niveomyces insectorum RCEF 264 TaxID=1081102 RepID=A0A162IBC0_9HYPO|nr:Flavin reductase-like, FMN-binding protein [Niveomyces insectorum RCEF 264]